ncbi:MAG: hypothetical protein K6G94_08390, partial [Kiritimatiellae bacterium]|nr:hypothetical protein [Kiritimatiellia bacterium]
MKSRQNRMRMASIVLVSVVCLCFDNHPAVAGDDAGPLRLAPERVAKIKEYLAAQKCPEPEIDAENYGAREAVPSGRFYYGWTLDP